MTTALQKYKKENYYLKYFALQIIYNLDALFLSTTYAMQGWL